MTPLVPFNADAIRAKAPSEMQQLDRWVAWKSVVRGGKPTKLPISAVNGGPASATNPATWCSFADAVSVAERDPSLAGIGFVFTTDDDVMGVDLDDCRDARTGEMQPWAQSILEQLSSYSEVSPSGSGVKVFVRASKPGTRCKTGYKSGAVEMYDVGRYFTVTGARLPEYSAEVEERQEAIDSLYEAVFTHQDEAPAKQRNHPTSQSIALSDDEIIELARSRPSSGAKFSALFDGNWSGHFGSASEADSSLVFTLAYYTTDAGQIDQIFRQSGLMREKWDERHGDQSYGERTISNALEKVIRQYTPRRQTRATRSAENGAVESISNEPSPGSIDPETGRLILATDRTLPTAEAFVRELHWHSDAITLRHYAGLLLEWHQNRYTEVEDDALRSCLLPWLHKAVRMHYDPRSEQCLARDFPANPNTVKAALESIKAYTHLAASTPSPSWLDGRTEPDPREILPCRSFLLHLPSMKRLPPTPSYFTVSALDYDYDSNAIAPMQWQTFLGQLFKDDMQALDLLQEWFGYCLTGDTSQQKMLLLVGPKRGGKGTIARVLARLIGAMNVCGPTISSLAGQFGLQPLIGKSLAIVSDARFSGENIKTVTERLLCISGEDTVTIDRKYLTSVTMKLPTRFVFLTNELPKLGDASGALASRFMTLRLTESFLGREDRLLTEKLHIELAGILNWAIEGRQRLDGRGYFVQPSSVEDVIRDLEDLSSPVGAFVRQRCEVGPGLRIWVDDLYQAWRQWCENDGRVTVTTKQTFGRDLMAAAPGVVSRQGTNGVRFYQGITLAGVGR